MRLCLRKLCALRDIHHSHTPLAVQVIESEVGHRELTVRELFRTAGALSNEPLPESVNRLLRRRTLSHSSLTHAQRDTKGKGPT